MCRLVKIAHEYNIAVVVTNHINRIPHSKEKFCRPIGGDVMGHAVTYSVWTLNQFIYNATIISGPYHPLNTKSFYIGNKGLVDDNPIADELHTISFLGFDLEKFLGM
jgi:Rad51